MCRFRLNPEKVVPLNLDHLLMIGRWSGFEKLGRQPHLGDLRQLPRVPPLSSGRYPAPVNGITAGAGGARLVAMSAPAPTLTMARSA